MSRRKSHRHQKPAAKPPEPYDPVAREAETERLRWELAQRILSVRCSNPRNCAKGACRRRQACQRRANMERRQARAARAAANRAARAKASLSPSR